MENFVYPKGAIQSVEEFQSFVGGKLYTVLGLGKGSFINEISDIKNIITDDIGTRFDCIKYDDIPGYEYLGDYNIGKHHNHHFIFTNEEDAKTYLKYAKEYTRVDKNKLFEEDDYYYDYD